MEKLPRFTFRDKYNVTHHLQFMLGDDRWIATQLCDGEICAEGVLSDDDNINEHLEVAAIVTCVQCLGHAHAYEYQG